MSITSGIVLYIIIWALVFYMVNPLWQTSQHEADDVVPGTPASAPVDAKLALKAALTTAITTVVFGVVFAVIMLDLISIADINWIEPPSQR